MNLHRLTEQHHVPQTDELQLIADMLHEIVDEELEALRREVAALSIQARRNDVILVLRAGPATVLFWAAVGILIGGCITAILMRVM